MRNNKKNINMRILICPFAMIFSMVMKNIPANNAMTGGKKYAKYFTSSEKNDDEMTVKIRR